RPSPEGRRYSARRRRYYVRLPRHARRPSGAVAIGRMLMPFAKLRKLAAAALAACLVLAGTAGAQQVVAPLDPPEQVRVAVVPILKFAALYVAAERGLFEKYGLDVDIDIVASGTEAIAFLEQGQIDRKSTRLNSSHVKISYAVFCLK